MIYWFSVVDCGNPPVIPNGMRQFSATTFGETVTYTCAVSFVLSGSSTLTCVASGSWGTPPICSRELIGLKIISVYCIRAAVCQDLPSPVNGMISYDTMFSPRPTGTVATYTCGTGYDIFGPRTRTCQSDTTWSGRRRHCLSRYNNTFNSICVYSYTLV